MLEIHFKTIQRTHIAHSAKLIIWNEADKNKTLFIVMYVKCLMTEILDYL